MSGGRFAAAFDAFLAYLATPHGRLRTALLGAWLASSLDDWPPPESPTALDVGCGAAPQAPMLLSRGFALTLVDPVPAALDRAPARAERICAGLEELPERLGDRRFDLVICHNVYEYTPDGAETLRALSRWLAPGGRLSLVALNAAQEPLRRAIRDGDLAGALTAGAVPSLYGVDRRPTSVASLAAEIRAAGLSLAALRGVFAAADYLPAAAIEADFGAALALEMAMGQEPQYAAVSRYLYAWAALSSAD